MKLGDINIAETIINNELRLGVLERAMDFITNQNFSLTKPTQQDLDNFRKQTLEDLKKKYPNMGLNLK